MPWKLTQHKTPKGQQDIKVSILLKEMANYTYATYSEEFERAFFDRLREIKRSNNFSAELLYKLKKINPKQVEIWKGTVTSDYKTKMFTVDYCN